MEDVLRLNLETCQGNQDRSPEEFRAEFRSALAWMLELAQSLDKGDFERSLEADWTNDDYCALRDLVTWRCNH